MSLNDKSGNVVESLDPSIIPKCISVDKLTQKKQKKSKLGGVFSQIEIKKTSEDKELLNEYDNAYKDEPVDDPFKEENENITPINQLKSIEVYFDINEELNDEDNKNNPENIKTLNLELDKSTTIRELIDTCIDTINNNAYEILYNNESCRIEIDLNYSKYLIKESRKNKTPKDYPPYNYDLILGDIDAKRFCLIINKDIYYNNDCINYIPI